MRWTQGAAVCLGLALWSSVSVARGQDVRGELIVEGLTQPLQVTHAPGDHGRIFVVEKLGSIKTVDLATREVRLYLDLTDRVTPDFEGGLLGLAFHPQFESNGLLYVNLTREIDDVFYTVIERYRASSDDGADRDSAMQLLAFVQDSDRHNGGWMGFGPNDGLLYIASGDGGLRRGSSQDLTLYLGKMLRIDVDRDDFPQDPGRNYGIPADNPFVALPDVLGEIWAYGLRNPWRCGFDRANGDLYIGDVGESRIEELDYQSGSSPGGQNYGWPCWEGSQGGGCDDPPGVLTLPIHEYPHSEGQSITGGEVYRGCAIAGLEGTYFFADVRTDRIWSMRVVNGEVADLRERTGELEPPGGDLRSTVTFGLDAYGEIYYTQFTRGQIFRIVSVDHSDINGNGVPDACECLADLTGSSDPDAPGYGVPDGDVDLDDYLYYMALFAAGDDAADLDRDGDRDADDFFAYLDRFAAGC